MVLHIQKSGFQKILSMPEFLPLVPGRNHANSNNFVKEFDITSCYKDDEKMRLSITFPLPSEADLTVSFNYNFL